MKYYLHPEIETTNKIQRIIKRACEYHNNEEDMYIEGAIREVESIEWFLIDAIDDICDEYDNKWHYLIESLNSIYGVNN